MARRPSGPRRQPHTIPRSQQVSLLLYLPLGAGFTNETYLAFLDKPQGEFPVGPFTLEGIQITLRSDPKNAIKDLQKAIKQPGSLVLYMSHTAWRKSGALGFDPEQTGKAALPNSRLTAWLQAASANVVVLAGCAARNMVGKLRNDVVVVTSDSGRDGLTRSGVWTRAFLSFLLAMVGYDLQVRMNVTPRLAKATVSEAITAAGRFFPRGEGFVLASGNGSFKLD